MKSMLFAGVALIAMSAIAAAGPVKLSDRQLDRVTAGASHLPGWPMPGHPPVADWPPRLIGPPTVNPGGPILISCVVGVGCTARHV